MKILYMEVDDELQEAILFALEAIENKERIENEDNHNDSIIKSLHLSSIFYNNDNYNMIYKIDENHERAIREYKLNYLLNRVESNFNGKFEIINISNKLAKDLEEIRYISECNLINS